MEKKTFSIIGKAAIEQLKSAGAEFVLVLMTDGKHYAMMGDGATSNLAMTDLIAGIIAKGIEVVEQQEGEETAKRFVEMINQKVMQRLNGNHCAACVHDCKDDEDLLAMPVASQAIN